MSAGSNSLPDLAARIRVEHRAASDKLSEALAHAMAAGDLLIEAKALVPHGGWLPWLAANVEISDRTARLYMQAAKNRAEIAEAAKWQRDADLSLGEAMALLALSSDVRKLLSFIKQCEGLDGEDLIKACLDANIPVVVTPGYDPFHGQSDEHRREWKLFGLWLIPQLGPKGANHHLEWLLRNGGGTDLSHWLGKNGDRYRAQWGMRPLSDWLRADWASFAASHATATEAAIDALTEAKAAEVEKQQAAWKAKARTPQRRMKPATAKRTTTLRRRMKSHD
jgi:Protein of unknown function (DUF3102)